MQCEHNIYNISKQYIIMFDVWDSITSNSASDDGYDFSSKNAFQEADVNTEKRGIGVWQDGGLKLYI